MSRYICARCGLAVYSWAKGDGITWKHAAGWRTGKSCGQKPKPVDRGQYADSVRRALEMTSAL